MHFFIFNFCIFSKATIFTQLLEKSTFLFSIFVFFSKAKVFTQLLENPRFDFQSYFFQSNFFHTTLQHCNPSTLPFVKPSSPQPFNSSTLQACNPSTNPSTLKSYLISQWSHLIIKSSSLIIQCRV